MKKYQVIITMGGTGKRFADAGYKIPKYMLPINILNKNHKVIDLIAGMYMDEGTEAKLIFLCNRDHIVKYNLNGLLKDYGTVVPVYPGKGPGDAVHQAREFIDPELPVFVQYCDTFQPWNIYEINEDLTTSNPDAAVVVTDEKCPSAFDGTLYGRVKVENNVVTDIKEKAPESFSKYIGCGTFFFKDGKTLLKYVDIQDKQRDKYYLNGESYVNCTIKAMLDDGCNVIPIPIDRYLNLGVPRDYEEFMYWQRTMNDLYNEPNRAHSPKIENSTLIMPAAGLGSRFKGIYDLPKPLIDVGMTNYTMFEEAICHSFSPEKTVIVSRKDLDYYDEFKEEAEKAKCDFIGLDKITDGQAITVLEGLKHINNGIVMVNSCDQGILYDESKFYELFPDADVIVCGIKGYQPAIQKPTSFSWIKTNGTDVVGITTKKCEGNPKDEYAFVSCLLYKNKFILERSIKSLIDRRGEINGELYIDETINDTIRLGYKVKMLEIDSYLNWGTPAELELFKWWYRFFENGEFYDYLA